MDIETLLLELNFWNGPIRIIMVGGGQMCCISGKGDGEVVGRASTYKRAIQNAFLEFVKKMDAKEDRKWHSQLGKEADEVKQEIEDRACLKS